jgi:hypothetical protein
MTTTELYPNGTTDPLLNIKYNAPRCIACGNIEHGSVNTKINCLTNHLANLREAYNKLININPSYNQLVTLNNQLTIERDNLLIEIEPYRAIRKTVKETIEKHPWKPY